MLISPGGQIWPKNQFFAFFGPFLQFFLQKTRLKIDLESSNLAWSCAWMLRTYMPNLVLVAQVVRAQRWQKTIDIQDLKKILFFFNIWKYFFDVSVSPVSWNLGVMFIFIQRYDSHHWHQRFWYFLKNTKDFRKEIKFATFFWFFLAV